jgi:trimeric autotransporter adhesin
VTTRIVTFILTGAIVAAAACDDSQLEPFPDPPPRGFEQQAYIKPSNTAADDRFGSSVALSADGKTLAVGALFEDSGATGVGGDQALDNDRDSGAVYVFTRADARSPWTQQAYIKAPSTSQDAGFGSYVALSADGSTLAVSAPLEGSNATGVNSTPTGSAEQSGAVYVFTRRDETWTEQAFIKASNAGDDDQFGSSLALSGDGSMLAVGAWFEDSPGTGVGGTQDGESEQASGAVYVFARTSTRWSQEAYLKASDSRAFINFGASAALSRDGSTLAVGTGTNGSTVYVFTRSSSTWTQRALVGASGGEPGDGFGSSVALSDDGSTLAVGAPLEDSAAIGVDGDRADDGAPQSGAVYVFTGGGAMWTQRAYLKASNTRASDEFGRRLALSSDGATLAVGAQLEGSAATGIDGDQADRSAPHSGAVYVFKSTRTTWTQQHYVKASSTARAARFGSSVALSGDGSTLAAGAFGESSTATGVDSDQADDQATKSGAVYILAAPPAKADDSNII